jgi:hypothetical protein
MKLAIQSKIDPPKGKSPLPVIHSHHSHYSPPSIMDLIASDAWFWNPLKTSFTAAKPPQYTPALFPNL